MANKKHTGSKQRGFWASFWIILFGLLSIVYAIFYTKIFLTTETLDKPILLGSLLVLTLADLVGLGAIWFWQKWGWYVFIVSSIASIVFGLIATGSLLVGIHEILPFVFLGWTYRNKWDMF